MLKSLAHPYILLGLAVLFWAGNSVVGRAFSEDLPPIAMVFWRWLIAALVLLPICIKPFMRNLGLIRAHLPYITLQGFLSITAFNSLLYWGLHYTTVVNTSLVQASMPVITLFFSWVLLRKGVTLLASIGIVLSLCGVAWVIAKGDLSTLAAVEFNPGDMIILLSMILWSIYTVLLAKAPKGLERMAFTFAMVVLGLLIVFPLYLWEYSTGARIHLDTNTILAFAYIGLFPSVLSFLFWNKGVEMVGANVAGIFLNLMPVYGAVLGMLLLGEVLEVYHYAGIVLIFAGIWLVTKMNKG